MTDFIPQFIPCFGDEEADSMNDYMRSGAFLMEFKKTQEFESRITEFTGAKHAIAVNNGTISLTLAGLSLELGVDDEVIVPNYTMIATPNSIKMLGCVPVFVDVCPKTLCMDLQQAENAITQKTKAIILVSANGRYPLESIDAFVALAKKYKIALIEDAAQSLGSFYPDGRHMGTVGDIGSFSFSVPKIISTGQGGALITNDDTLAKKIRKAKDFGRTGGGNDIHDTIGWNFKFTDMQAVIGNEQMKKLPWRINRKKEIYQLYKEALKSVPQVQLFNQDLTHTTPWFIDIMVSEKRDELSSYLKENGVGTRPMYPPINEQECYNIPGIHTVSQSVGKNGLWLPSSVQLDDTDIDTICKKIKTFFA